MTARWAVGLLTPVILAMLASPSHAFEGHRRGFILGVGIGPGLTHLSNETAEHYPVSFDSSYILVPATRHSSGNRATLGTDFRLGFGLTDRLLLYYDNKVSWSGTPGGLVNDGLTSMAVSYYFNDAHPSAYLTGGIGSAGVAALLFDGGSTGYNGLGFFGGGGYEMTKRVSVEGTITYGLPDEEGADYYGPYKLTTTVLSFRAHLLFLWY